MTNYIATESQALQALRDSSQHRVPGWIAESDLVLDETMGVLDDAAHVGAGAIITACSSALESLFTDLLPDASPERIASRGLVAKALALAKMWPDAEAATEFLDHIRWLAQRRNSFAHRLIDEGGPWDPTGTKYDFNNEAVEEAFQRIGEVVTILDRGYDAYVGRCDEA